MKKDKAVISLVTWNRIEGTKQTLEALFEHTFGDYKIYVTDNGSTDGTVEYLKSLSGYPVETIFLKENIGIAQARNCHWWKCFGYDVVRMDNDVVVETDDWFNILRDISYEHQAFVGITPDSYLPIVGDKIRQETIFTDELPQHEQYLYSVAGNLMFVPKRAIFQLGHWCEDYGLHAFEDTDYALKGEILGYNQIFTTKVKHKHLYEETSYIQKHGEEITNKNWALLRHNLVRFKLMLEKDDKRIHEAVKHGETEMLFGKRVGTARVGGVL